MHRPSVAALVVALAVSAVVVSEGSAAPPPSPTPVAIAPPLAVTVTAEMRAHQRWLDTLYFGRTAYGFLVLLAVLGLGFSRRLRDVAVRVARRPFVAAMALWALLVLVTTALGLPMKFLSGFFVPHRFGVSSQGVVGWLWDQAKAMVLEIAIGAPLVAMALAGIRHVRRWWLALWLGSMPVLVLLVLVAPVLLGPAFNTFKPLADSKLKAELLDLASRAGIAAARVVEVDRSKQTNQMNAYVAGLGPTKQIVLWDTLIAKLDHDELRFVMAHEMGHDVLHHVWKLLAFAVVALFVVLWLTQRVAEWATARWGRCWGFEVAHDPAAVPLLLLVLGVFTLLGTPAVNALSRRYEPEADTFALELTHLNDAGARAFVKLAEDSKVLPDPPAFIRFWRCSHPTLAERIAFCSSYRPWLTGAPNRAWQGVR